MVRHGRLNPGFAARVGASTIVNSEAGQLTPQTQYNEALLQAIEEQKLKQSRHEW